MAQYSSERPLSSSSLSLSQPSVSPAYREQSTLPERPKGPSNRQQVFVDGEFLRIVETPRRRQVDIAYGQLKERTAHRASIKSSATGSSSSGHAVLKVHDQQRLTSPSPWLGREARQQSIATPPRSPVSFMEDPIDDSVRQNKSIQERNDDVDLPSPPPTPRITRLPTPDLPPLKGGRFCDCKSCQ